MKSFVASVQGVPYPTAEAAAAAAAPVVVAEGKGKGKGGEVSPEKGSSAASGDDASRRYHFLSPFRFSLPVLYI